MRYLTDVRATIELIKDNVDLNDLVTSTLEREADKIAGKNHWYVCPFHNENEPSFAVNNDSGFYYCFGCKETGDVITWMTKVHGINITSAIFTLADQYNIDISSYLREPTGDERLLERSHEILQTVIKICCAQVTQPAPLNFLQHTRRFTVDTITDYNIGYNLNVHSLVNELINNDVAKSDITSLELDKPMMWDNVIVYPIIDRYGKCFGFKNRPLHSSNTRYFGNSTSYPLISRLPMFYGLKQGIKAAKEQGYIILVEGSNDVLACRSAGILNVVSMLGSELSKKHLGELSRHQIDNLVLLPDGDEAGFKLAERFSEAYADMGSDILVRVGLLLDGDPDECIRNHGVEVLNNVIDNAMTPVEFKIRSFLLDVGTNVSHVDQVRFFHDVAPYLKKISPVERQIAIKIIHKHMGISYDVVEDQINYYGLASSEANIKTEQIVLKFMLVDEVSKSRGLSILKTDDFVNRSHKNIFDFIKDRIVRRLTVTIDAVLRYYEDEQHHSNVDALNRISSSNITKYDFDDLAEDLIQRSDRRKLVQKADALKRSARDQGLYLSDVVSAHLSDVVTIGVNREDLMSATPRSQLRSSMDTVKERLLSDDSIIGIELGSRFAQINYAFSGMEEGHFNVVAGPTGSGKSICMVNWATHMALLSDDPTPCLIITHEMTEEETIHRILSIISGVSNTNIREGNLTQEEMSRLNDAAKIYHKRNNLHIRRPESGTCAEWLALTDYYLLKHGVKIVFIDYLQLMSRSSKDPRYQQLGDASGALKRRAQKAKQEICYVGISQLNADHQASGGTHWDTAGSRQIAMDSDKYLILMPKSEQQVKMEGIQNGNIYFRLSKFRFGAPNQVYNGLLDNGKQFGLPGSLRMGEIKSWNFAEESKND